MVGDLKTQPKAKAKDEYKGKYGKSSQAAQEVAPEGTYSAAKSRSSSIKGKRTTHSHGIALPLGSTGTS